MTNTEYETASIAAAGCYDRLEGEHRLKQYDEMIAQVEKTLARLQEERRELVNRYDLNKCEHKFVVVSFGVLGCHICGKGKFINGTRN